jgi:hypothetical protein
MDHAENVAKALYESVIAGARMDYRVSQSNGEHDFDLNYPDGRTAAVEVTSSVNQTLEETHSAITDKRKGGNAIRTTLCQESWYIFPGAAARISLIRKEGDRYLADIEAAGIRQFRWPVNDHPTVEAICRDLGVISGEVADWLHHESIVMALPGGGGAIGVSTVTGAALRETFKADNRRKLGASGCAERHLAVYVYLTSMAWLPLSEFEPIPEVPELPPEITDIAVFSESTTANEYVIWRASSSSPWTKQKLFLQK